MYANATRCLRRFTLRQQLCARKKRKSKRKPDKNINIWSDSTFQTLNRILYVQIYINIKINKNFDPNFTK